MKRLVLFPIALVFVTGLALGLHQAFAQSPTPDSLEAMALPRDAFPNGFLLEEGPITPQDLSQPLNPDTVASAGMDRIVLQFQEGYHVAVIVWDGSSSLFVGHYLYRYADDLQAQRALEQLTASLSFQKDPDGWTGFWKDSEGGSLAVRLQIRGPVVTMLIVNGLSESSTRAALDHAIRALAPRPAR